MMASVKRAVEGMRELVCVLLGMLKRESFPSHVYLCGCGEWQGGQTSGRIIAFRILGTLTPDALQSFRTWCLECGSEKLRQTMPIVPPTAATPHSCAPRRTHSFFLLVQPQLTINQTHTSRRSLQIASDDESDAEIWLVAETVVDGYPDPFAHVEARCTRLRMHKEIVPRKMTLVPPNPPA